MCCNPWGHKESDMTERLNWAELNIRYIYSSYRGSSWPRDQSHILCGSCAAGGFFTAESRGKLIFVNQLVQFSSVTQSCLTLCEPMYCSPQSLPVHHQLLEFTETHVHWVGDNIQPSCPLLSPSSPIFNLSQHQGLFKWLSSLHQVAKVLEFQLQH